MKFKILTSILAIVLIAGCAIPEIPGMGPSSIIGTGIGLEIISFTADPTTVFSRGRARITVEVENKGGSTVDNNSALVFLTGSNINLAESPVTGKYWYGRDTDDKYEIQHFSRKMEPEDVVRGIPADIERFSWTLVAPNLTQGQTRDDTFIVRVYNEYSSGVNGNIWAYTDAEAQATEASGKAFKKSSFTAVPGPVAATVKLTPDPVILYEDETEFTFMVEITNTQTGTIYKNNTIDYTTANASKLSLDAESALNWVFVDVVTDLIITDCVGDQEVFGGRSMTLVCEAKIPSTHPLVTFRSYPVDIAVKYGYYTEREVAVKVQGK